MSSVGVTSGGQLARADLEPGETVINVRRATPVLWATVTEDPSRPAYRSCSQYLDCGGKRRSNSCHVHLTHSALAAQGASHEHEDIVTRKSLTSCQLRLDVTISISRDQAA